MCVLVCVSEGEVMVIMMIAMVVMVVMLYSAKIFFLF